MSSKTGFVNPKDFGIETPINTKEELCTIADAINSVKRDEKGRIVSIGTTQVKSKYVQANNTTYNVVK